MSVTTTSSYLNWQPVKHSVVKDAGMAETLHEKGYVVMPFLNAAQLEEIKALYAKEHTLKVENGGMFYSMYSKDLAYRQRVHQGIHQTLQPLLEQHFKDYKNVVNTFITKVSGPKSEFYTHQDTTALDEFKHSPLSVWIPLQDMNEHNGAMAVIEKSHWFFSPYRGISFSFPFHNIQSTVKQYLKPLYLKAGEALIFDSRLVHNSMPNVSGSDRLVALCGVFPKDAEIVTCYKEKSEGSKIELIKHPDAYLLENENFYYDCHTRPQSGEVIGTVSENFPDMSGDTFENLCALNGIEKTHAITDVENLNCQFIAEPDGHNLDIVAPANAEKKVETVWERLKAVFN